jgi:hypothetical protein
MKKYRNYIIITAILALAALYFILKEQSGTLKLDVHYFALSDTTEISRIEISSRADTVVLQQTGDNWVVNQTYNAKIKLIKGIMGLLTTMEINAPVPKKFRQVVLNEFNRKSIHVKFESNTQTLKEFEICDIDSLQLGSFIKKPDSNDVYIVRIPGFNNPLTLFFPDNIQVWREKVIFRYKPWEILTIHVDYPSMHQASFILDLSNPKQIALRNNQNSKPVLLNKDNITPYLLNFQSIPFHSLPVYKRGLIDSLKKSTPYCIISVKNIDNQLNKLCTYTVPTHGKSGKIDLFKMYAVIQNDTIPFILKYTDIDPVMKKFSDMGNK